MADLGRVLHRSVLRAARVMDRHTHLKALVVRTDELLEGNPSAQAAHEFFNRSSSHPSIKVEVADPETGELVALPSDDDKQQEDVQENNPFVSATSSKARVEMSAQQKLLNDVFSSALGGQHALYYVPPSPGLGPEELKKRQFTTIAKEYFRNTTDDHLDVAFTLLREMNRCIALGKLIRKQDKEEKASGKKYHPLVSGLRRRMQERWKQQTSGEGDDAQQYGRAQNKLNPGVVLIAHPLQTGYFGQTVIFLDKYDEVPPKGQSTALRFAQLTEVQETGAEGIILNKPTPYSTKQILPEDEGNGYLDYFGFQDRPLFDGGPVPTSLGAIVSLHKFGITGSKSEVIPGVFRGLSLQQGSSGPWLNTGVVPLASSLSSTPEHGARLLREPAACEDEINIHVTRGPEDNEGQLLVGKKSDLRLYWGKAVWIKGQLENELRLGSWVVGRLHKDVVLDPIEPKGEITGQDCHDVLTSYWQGALRLLGSPYAEMRKLQRVCAAPAPEPRQREIRIVAV